MIIIYGLGGEIGTGLEILSILLSEGAFTGTAPGQLRYKSFENWLGWAYKCTSRSALEFGISNLKRSCKYKYQYISYQNPNSPLLLWFDWAVH